MSNTVTAAVIGAGPAGLMAAERLSAAGIHVVVYDAMPTAGRKFLMAGRGGLNLTHSEPEDRFRARYGEAAQFLAAALDAFSPADLRAWADALGETTFAGSSGRVFPRSFKASPLLRAWLSRLAGSGVRFALRHRWIGWDDDSRLLFRATEDTLAVRADAVVLALGGASWPRLGSDGRWVEILRARGVAVRTLAPSNCGFMLAWSDHFRTRFAGTPLKRIALSFGGRTVRGEAMVTEGGLEGGAVYALSGALRDALAAGEDATALLDLRPDLDAAALAARLSVPRGSQSLSNFLRKRVGLSPVAIALLRESGETLPAEPDALAASIKAVPLRFLAPAPITRAISSAGGVPFEAIDSHFMLKALPGVFVAGEMLDWEAPTGGYLLQACFATGAAAGQGAAQWLGRTATPPPPPEAAHRA